MERRRSLRRPASITVLVYRKGLPISWAEIGDISMHGIFIKGLGGDLRRGDSVDIEFPFAGDCHSEHCRLSASVIHRRVNGFGLNFHQGDTQILHCLLRHESAINDDRLQVKARLFNG